MAKPVVPRSKAVPEKKPIKQVYCAACGCEQPAGLDACATCGGPMAKA